MFFEKQDALLRNKISEFLDTYKLQIIKEDVYDEKKLFEIENEYARDEKETKENFKEVFAQYILVQLKNKNKELKINLHTHSGVENEILKKIEEHKKLIHMITENDCQFINNMV